jgi:23S rRNA (guanosine2251-2'-O)-methyltransferase
MSRRFGTRGSMEGGGAARERGEARGGTRERGEGAEREPPARGPGGRMVYGFHAVGARLRQRPESIRELWVDRGREDPRMRTLLLLAKDKGIRAQQVPVDRLDGMLPGVRHQGVACAVPGDEPVPDLDEVLDALQARGETPLLLLLDGVTDPHNLGACLRSADALGVHAVAAPKDRAVGITPVVEKVASGAVETVPYVMVTNLARTIEGLQDRGLAVVGLADKADAELWAVDLSGPLALVLGAEGTGLRRLTRERCDRLARIPMSGSVETLNVSVATGVCLYEVSRQRRKAP